MTVKKITLHQFTLGLVTLGLAACFLLAGQCKTALGQDAFAGNLIENDLQFFSPVDFDFENLPIKKEHGWTFRYDKLSWAMTGDRVTVGNPDVQVFSEIIVPDALAESFSRTSGPIRSADLQYQIINGLQDVAPIAQFGWGERYEFGRFDGNSGWQISILDGPEVNVNQVFGTGPQQSGFGSIHVNFATPANFLLGFRDYWGGGEETSFFVIPTPTLNGPGIVPGNEVPGNFIDDLDGDGVEGFNFIVDDIDGDGTIGDDEVIGIAVDLDDLHLFNVTFDQVFLRNTTETQGVEIMKTIRLSNGNRMKKNQNRHFDIGYGVRFLRLRDQFSFNGTSPLLGTMQFTTEAENQLIGPQLRAQWSTQQGRWKWNFDGRAMLAYNITDSDQTGSYGLDNVETVPGVDGADDVINVINPGLVPGAFNRLISGQPNTFSYGRRDDEFSPTVEVRAELSYQITGSIAARLGYTGIFVDNISRGAAITNYSLPDFGFLQGGKQDIFINGANFGFDVVY
ncbi:MAG: BBP7 family outer membrane beta-barrel protein [Planctomycetes bacterium]|nr:BBP7 family outer membrane beta-barrel protein [Planctomycetota bacterium]